MLWRIDLADLSLGYGPHFSRALPPAAVEPGLVLCPRERKPQAREMRNPAVARDEGTGARNEAPPPVLRTYDGKGVFDARAFVVQMDWVGEAAKCERAARRAGSWVARQLVRLTKGALEPTRVMKCLLSGSSGGDQDEARALEMVTHTPRRSAARPLSMACHPARCRRPSPSAWKYIT